MYKERPKFRSVNFLEEFIDAGGFKAAPADSLRLLVGQKLVLLHAPVILGGEACGVVAPNPANGRPYTFEIEGTPYGYVFTSEHALDYAVDEIPPDKRNWSVTEGELVVDFLVGAKLGLCLNPSVGERVLISPTDLARARTGLK